MIPLLEVAGVSKSYGGRVALDGVDISIEAGEVVALSGPNGAGKSTLFSIIAGIVQPDRGTVVVTGTTRGGGPIGFAPQDVGLYLTMTVRENLAGFGALEALHGTALEHAIESAANALSLEDLLDRSVRTLSSGEQRRVHVAVSLLHRPVLLLLDEPTAGVDAASRERLLRLVRKAADEGCGVCYSTHYLTELETVADRVVQLEQGRVIQELSPATLLDVDSHRIVTIGFDGMPPWPFPSRSSSDSTTTVGHEVLIRTADPASTIRATLSMLGPEAERVRTIDITRTSLETALLGQSASTERMGAG